MGDVARRNRLRAAFDLVAERYDAVRPHLSAAVGAFEEYATATHRALLLTYSNHLALPDDLREGLLDCIDAVIDARYGAELVVAPR
jgi:hypothetical protein